MCESTALQCQQCDKHKTSCRGQVGTFDPGLCPDIPCAKCAACEQGCKQSRYRVEECKKEDGCYYNGIKGGPKRYRMQIDYDSEKYPWIADELDMAEAHVEPVEDPEGEWVRVGENGIYIVGVDLAINAGILLSTRKEVFALYCYMECRDVLACEADECPFFKGGACNEGWKEEIERIKARCLQFLGK